MTFITPITYMNWAKLKKGRGKEWSVSLACRTPVRLFCRGLVTLKWPLLNQASICMCAWCLKMCVKNGTPPNMRS